MRKHSILITSGIVAAIWLLLTAWIAFGPHVSFLFSFSFFFHLIPWGIGFSEGTTVGFYLSYLITWLILTLLFSPIVRAYFSSKKKRLFLSVSIGPIVISIIIGLYLDHINERNRNERIALNRQRDQADFKPIRTGDLLFQVINKDSSEVDFEFTDSAYNNIAIAFVTDGNYALLETKDKVQFVSMRQWIDRGVQGHFVVKRLLGADSLLSTEEQTISLSNTARKFIMKKADTSLEWSDENIYCSELVWKVFEQEFGIELAALKIKEITISRSDFKSRVDYEVSAKNIYNSEHLITVEKE